MKKTASEQGGLAALGAEGRRGDRRRRRRSPASRWSGRRTSRTSRSTTPACPIRRLPTSRKQASKDLGFKVEMSVVDHPGPAEPHGQRSEVDRHRRHRDLADQGRGAAGRDCRRVEIAKIKNWGELTPLYTEGTFAGKEVSRQGDAPIEFIYRDAVDATTFATGKTDFGELRARASTTPTRWASAPTSSAARSPPGPT